VHLRPHFSEEHICRILQIFTKLTVTPAYLVVRCTLRAIGGYLILNEFLLVMGKETSSPSLHIVVLISPLPDQEGNKLRSISGTRAISTVSRRELSSSSFFFLQRKAPKEIHAILKETLVCFLPGRAKDLSAPL